MAANKHGRYIPSIQVMELLGRAQACRPDLHACAAQLPMAAAFPGLTRAGRVIDSWLIGEPGFPCPGARFWPDSTNYCSRVDPGAACLRTPRGACARRRVQSSVAVGRVVTAEITGTQSDQDGCVSNYWKPDVRTRGDAQKVGDELGTFESPRLEKAENTSSCCCCRKPHAPPSGYYFLCPPPEVMAGRQPPLLPRPPPSRASCPHILSVRRLGHLSIHK